MVLLKGIILGLPCSSAPPQRVQQSRALVWALLGEGRERLQLAGGAGGAVLVLCSAISVPQRAGGGAWVPWGGCADTTGAAGTVLVLGTMAACELSSVHGGTLGMWAVTKDGWRRRPHSTVSPVWLCCSSRMHDVCPKSLGASQDCSLGCRGPGAAWLPGGFHPSAQPDRFGGSDPSFAGSRRGGQGLPALCHHSPSSKPKSMRLDSALLAQLLALPQEPSSAFSSY